MSGLVGLVLAGGAADQVGVEPFFMELIAGMEEALGPHGTSVLLLVVPDREAELAAYDRWAAGRTVSAVVVVNLVHRDVRPGHLAALGLPAVLAGRGDALFSRVITDDAAAMAAAIDALIALGHRDIGRVSGPTTLIHTAERSAAMSAAAGVRVTEVEGDYSSESGVRGIRALLAADPRPTAVIFDNDVMAVAAEQELARAGIPVPAAMSLLACDDSPLCELATPPLSALSKNVHEHGLILGEAILAALGGAAPQDRAGPAVRIQLRESTGPAPA
ncbi:DNA-binding LacI/PurR family transcriptional regulator [Actinoplanes lutulentus]|uniref:DNA-binding LacI/PurR family transcriptional regulator n=1 Tax=Actinoplanes lutulentus TaxID=1287878 RepID=A0A327ZBA4_9ACTN|nr:substrate-binding domain-containing protein [Actinoplanes lutulentus]RAK36723.1 DNA-binding LacI/PurR family transcriptional regulator [Actinoplanes lutulentus]